MQRIFAREIIGFVLVLLGACDVDSSLGSVGFNSGR